ncbi:lactate 2-monooxygenase, partial [Kutzneria sp. 744]
MTAANREGHRGLRRLPVRDLLRRAARGAAVAADGLRRAGGTGREGPVAVAAVVRRRRGGGRAHAAFERVGLRQVGADAPDVRGA